MERNKIQPGQMIVFTHVPKTAGTSFQMSLVEPNLPADQIYPYHGLKRFLRDRRRERTFVWGHVPYGVHAFVGREVSYVTFLRDPVDRAVSYYYFVKDSDPTIYKHPARDDAEAMGIVEFYEQREYQNWQARYLAGLPHHYLYAHHRSNRLDSYTLATAISNLADRYLCFGVQERFGESLEVFRHRLGWSEGTQVERQKITYKRPQVAALDPAIRESLEELNSLDCKLYEFASERFEQQLTT